MQAGSVIFTDNPAADGVAVSDAGSQGLGGTIAHTIAAASPGVGTVGVLSTLTVNAPSSTIPGTITFTVA